MTNPSSTAVGRREADLGTDSPEAGAVAPAEPAAGTATAAGRRSRGGRLSSRIERSATILFFVAFFAIVGIDAGSRFLSLDNVLLVLGQNATAACAAIAVTITLIAGQFDLSAGALVGLAGIVLAGLTANEGVPLGAAIVLVLLLGAVLGLVNGALVTGARVNAFIATLGTGSAFGGIALLYSDGATIFEGVPKALTDVGASKPLGIPLPLIAALIVGVLLWALTRRMLAGRSWYAVGANPEAARLAGIGVDRMTVYAFVVGGVVAAIGGILLTAQLGSADPSSGPGLLLPAFAAAFLGSSIFSDGRFSIAGAVIATFLIGYAQDGLDALGLAAGAKPIFTGAILVGAVALTEHLRRRSATAR